MKRHQMSRRGSRKLFSRTASRHASINYKPAPMRGGIRL
ncbi:MAG: hypothetical protein [Microvirus sp.]|nr:MAG: hypothetical protein [Microvirus sp.]